VVIGRHRLLLALAAVVAVESSACTALLGGNDPIEIIGENAASGDDGAEPPEAAPDAAPEAAEDAPGMPEADAGDSAQVDVVTDVDTDVDAFAPPPDSGPPPPPDAGAVCPTAPVPSLSPWPGVTQEIDACSGPQLATFTGVCTTGGNSTACSTWQQDPTNSVCVSCLFGTRDGGPPDGKGALNLVGSQTYLVNLAGCIDLADPGINGADCANALGPSMECEVIACNACLSDPTLFQACVQEADSSSVCAPYSMSSQAACAAEYADGGAATTVCSSELDVLVAICGSGP
jgi:hypothetical protein